MRNDDSDVQDELLDIPIFIMDVRDEIADIPDEVLNIPVEVLDVQNEIPNVQEEILDIQNVIHDVPNDTRDIQEQLSDIRNRLGSQDQLIFSGGNLMAYKRRSSQVIADAQERATNLKAVDPALDLGGGLTVSAFESEIATVQTALETYNTLLAQADAALNELNDLEKNLGTLSGRMLAGVGVRFGKDSSEYEMAGGTRTSEIKRRRSKPEVEPDGGDGQ